MRVHYLEIVTHDQAATFAIIIVGGAQVGLWQT